MARDARSSAATSARTGRSTAISMPWLKRSSPLTSDRTPLAGKVSGKLIDRSRACQARGGSGGTHLVVRPRVARPLRPAGFDAMACNEPSGVNSENTALRHFCGGQFFATQSSGVGSPAGGKDP
jgi:hypothetical protein